MFSTRLIKTFITGKKTQTIEFYPTVRLTATPHEVSHRLLTVDPGPVTFSSDVGSSSPPVYQVSLRIIRFHIRTRSVFTIDKFAKLMQDITRERKIFEN